MSSGAPANVFNISSNGAYRPFVGINKSSHASQSPQNATVPAPWLLDTYHAWGAVLLGDQVLQIKSDFGRATARNTLVGLVILALVGLTGYQYASNGELTSKMKFSQVAGQKFGVETNFAGEHLDNTNIPFCTCGNPATAWGDIVELSANVSDLINYNAATFVEYQCSNIVEAGTLDPPVPAGEGAWVQILSVTGPGYNVSDGPAQMMDKYRHSMCQTMLSAILATVNATQDTDTQALGLFVQTPLLYTTKQLTHSWNANIGTLLQNLVWSFQGTVAAQAAAFQALLYADDPVFNPAHDTNQYHGGDDVPPPAVSADEAITASISLAADEEIRALNAKASTPGLAPAATAFWTLQTLEAINTLFDSSLTGEMFSAQFIGNNFQGVNALPNDVGSRGRSINIPGNYTLVRGLLQWANQNIRFNWTEYEKSCAAIYCTTLATKTAFERFYEFASVVGGLWTACITAAVWIWFFVALLWFRELGPRAQYA